MASFADVGNTLQVLAGVSLILGAAMAVYWGTRRGYPGFGLWTVCNILFAVSCLLLADQDDFAEVHGHRGRAGPHRPRDYHAPRRSAPLLRAAALRLPHPGRAGGRHRASHRLPVRSRQRSGPHRGDRRRLLPRHRRRWPRPSSSRRNAAGKRTYLVERGARVVVVRSCWSRTASTGRRGSRCRSSSSIRPNFAFFILVVMFEVVWFIVFLSLGTTKTTETWSGPKRRWRTASVNWRPSSPSCPTPPLPSTAERRVIAWNRAAEELTGHAGRRRAGQDDPRGGPRGLDAGGVRRFSTWSSTKGCEAPAGLMNVRREGDVLSAELETEFPRQTRPRAASVGGRDLAARPGRPRDRRDREPARREQPRAGRADHPPAGAAIPLAVRAQSRRHSRPRSRRQPPGCQPRRLRHAGHDTGELRLAGHAGVVARGPGVEERLRRPAARRTGLPGIHLHPQGPKHLHRRLHVGDLPRQLRLLPRVRRVPRHHRAAERPANAGARARPGCFRPRPSRTSATARSTWRRGASGCRPRLCVSTGWPRGRLLPLDSLRGSSSFSTSLTPWRLRFGGCRRMVAASTFTTASSGPVTAPGAHLRSRYRNRLRRRRPSRQIHGVMQDVTDLSQADDILRLTQYSMDHSGDQIFWLDSKGRFVFVSDSTLEQLGYTREEFLGMSDQRPRPDGAAGQWEERLAANQAAGVWTDEGRPHDQDRRAHAGGPEHHVHRARGPRVQLRPRAGHQRSGSWPRNHFAVRNSRSITPPTRSSGPPLTAVSSSSVTPPAGTSATPEKNCSA